MSYKTNNATYFKLTNSDMSHVMRMCIAHDTFDKWQDMYWQMTGTKTKTKTYVLTNDRYWICIDMYGYVLTNGRYWTIKLALRFDGRLRAQASWHRWSANFGLIIIVKIIFSGTDHNPGDNNCETIELVVLVTILMIIIVKNYSLWHLS